MLSSRCEENAWIGIFTRSESHFLYDPFLEVLCFGRVFQCAVLWRKNDRISCWRGKEISQRAMEEMRG